MIRYNGAWTDLVVKDGQVVRENGQPFSREDYSRFKYGWLPPAEQYAYGIANRLTRQLWLIAHRRPVFIVSAPYKYVPTASHAIAQYLEAELAIRAVDIGREPPVLVPFHKRQVGDSSYAQSSLADRQAALQTLGLHIDESIVPDSVLVVVDDIRITGTAEQTTAAYLEPLGPHAIFYMHAARLSPADATAHPGLEDELNQSVPHTLERFRQEAVRGEFRLNTRVLRFIMESNCHDLRDFAKAATTDMVDTIVRSAIGTGTAYCSKYYDSVRMLRRELANRTTANQLLVS